MRTSVSRGQASGIYKIKYLVVEAYIVLLNVQIFHSCFLFIFFFNLCSFMYFNLGSCSLYCISSIFHSGEIFEF